MPVGPVRYQWVGPARLFLVFVFLQMATWAAELPETVSWFAAQGNLGAKDRAYSLVFRLSTVQVYKGSHRVAPAMLAGQTYPAYRYSLEAQHVGADTSFWMHETGLFRSVDGKTEQPVWTHAVRGGAGTNESAHIEFHHGPLEVSYHNDLYGDGSASLEPQVRTPGQLWVLAMDLAARNDSTDLQVISDLAEEGFVRKVWSVSGKLTSERQRVDDVVCRVVRFRREDGAAAEFWVSLDAGRILRARNFRGTWFQLVQ